MTKKLEVVIHSHLEPVCLDALSTQQVMPVAPVIIFPPSKKNITFSREQLKIHASGKISDIFGNDFAFQDDYVVQVRMPEPPLLLADRVTALEAEPMSMGTGMITTETDVTADSWYLQRNRMPMGLTVEAGQADLMLVSWLGVDKENQGKRIYRLLGCEMTLHGPLPKVGDTIQYRIHIDRHIKVGDVRLFFFHSDGYINGQLILSVRDGQAGFFSQKELDESSGVIWDVNKADFAEHPRLDQPVVKPKKIHYSQEALLNLAQGKTQDCFGAGYELLQTHTLTPLACNKHYLLLDEITALDIAGGPKKRGYIKGIQKIRLDDWFLTCHFKNDACMPGTMMLDAGLQLAAFYLTALGFTLKKDGWRFEPVRDQTFTLVCRGQVTPKSKEVSYEIYIDEVIASPYPKITFYLIGSVDGLIAFQAHVGLQLVPGWPLLVKQSLGEDCFKQNDKDEIIAKSEDFLFDHKSLIACAWGKGSDSFGPTASVLDDGRRFPRLPGPPYHFISRIREVTGQLGEYKKPIKVVAEYDVNEKDWYFDANGDRIMPFAVLLEVALQPCGWLASFTGVSIQSKKELFFRNLDGTGTVNELVLAEDATIITKSKLTKVVKLGDTTITQFSLTQEYQGKVLYHLETVFGFFTKEAFANQVGLPYTDDEFKRYQALPNHLIDLTQRPAEYFGQALRLADPMLLMIDRITDIDEDQKNNITKIKAEKDVKPDDWFFKAHFFQDPVQPGSLGLEAIIQVMQFYLLYKNTQKNIKNPIFETAGLGDEHVWKYRGQVVPTNKKIVILVDIIDEQLTKSGAAITANASLWVDEKKIYTVEKWVVRVVSSEHKKQNANTIEYKQKIDLEHYPWLADHRPTWTDPVIPMVSVIEYMAEKALTRFPGKKVLTVQQAKVVDWLVLDKPLDLVHSVLLVSDNTVEVRLYRKLDKTEKMLAVAQLALGQEYPKSPLIKPIHPEEKPSVDSYQEGFLFHDESYQCMTKEAWGEACSKITLNAKTLTSGKDLLNQILLDAVLHGIPHAKLSQWNALIPTNKTGYPAIMDIQFYQDAPVSGEVVCYSRWGGFHKELKTLPFFNITAVYNDLVWCEIKLVDMLLPIPEAFASLPKKSIRDFIENRTYDSTLFMTEFSDNKTYADENKIREIDWLPGMLVKIYGILADQENWVEHLIIKEHFSRFFKEHPANIKIKNAFAFKDGDQENKIKFFVNRDKDIISISHDLKQELE